MFRTLCAPLVLLALVIDLRITDSKGTEVVVRDAAIDYSGMLGGAKETKGIQLLQGDGAVFVKWDDVESVRLSPGDSTVKPRKTNVEVTLKGGKRVTAELARKGKMLLVGKSELGDYMIELDKVRSISPVR